MGKKHIYDKRNSYSHSEYPNKCNFYPLNGRTTIVNARIKKFDGKPIIGWKKSFVYGDLRRCLIKLEIPANAARFQPKNYKCRASRAKVLDIYSPYGEFGEFNENQRMPDTIKACSGWDKSFIYEVGKVVKPTRKFSNKFERECASGIHFFLTHEEANKYSI